MLFSSIVFLLYFFPIVLLIYYALSFNREMQNIFLLIASLIFYAWGDVKYTLILISSIVLNYIFGLIIDSFRRQENIKAAKVALAITCFSNIGILFVFKYLNFVVRNINDVFSSNIIINEIALPLGISFFTFQALSYVIDVYRGNATVQKNPLNLGLYISFFPQLIAGPIVRYTSIEQQIHFRKTSFKKISVGCCRFVTGLSKKILIANNMATVADNVWSLVNVSNASVTLSWLGSIAYTLQIFFDFSAYSDMAIGLGLIFGFEFEENFNYPYISKSVSEFWRRWHISLSTWFKDYIYFPLGGSRVKNKDVMIRNMFVVWFLTGVWHGAEWTFIIWGLLNFVVIVLERAFINPKSEKHAFIRHIYTLLIINFGWVLFRAENINSAVAYILNMFGVNANGIYCDTTLMFLKEYALFFIVAIILSTPIAKRCNKLFVEKKFRFLNIYASVLYPICIIGLFIICITYLVMGSYNPFIYFNF